MAAAQAGAGRGGERRAAPARADSSAAQPKKDATPEPSAPAAAPVEEPQPVEAPQPGDLDLPPLDPPGFGTGIPSFGQPLAFGEPAFGDPPPASDSPAFSEPAFREPAVAPRPAPASQVLAEETSSSSPDINDASLPAIRLKPLEEDSGFRSAWEDGEAEEEAEARHEQGPLVAILGPLGGFLSRVLTPLAPLLDRFSSRGAREEVSLSRPSESSSSRDEADGPTLGEKLKAAWSGLTERLAEAWRGLTARLRRSESEPEADEEDEVESEPEPEPKSRGRPARRFRRAASTRRSGPPRFHRWSRGPRARRSRSASWPSCRSPPRSTNPSRSRRRSTRGRSRPRSWDRSGSGRSGSSCSACSRPSAPTSIASARAGSRRAADVGQIVFKQIDKRARAGQLNQKQQQALVEATARLPHLTSPTILMIYEQSPVGVMDASEVFQLTREATERGIDKLPPADAEELRALQNELAATLRPPERRRLDEYDEARARRVIFPFENPYAMDLVAKGARALPSEKLVRLRALLQQAVAEGLKVPPAEPDPSASPAATPGNTP